MKDINKILKISKHLVVLFATMLGVIYIAGCTDDGIDGSYNDGLLGSDAPKPIVESYTPADFAYSGVSEMTINGQNLTPSPFVYFTGGVEANILSASNSQLVILAPVYEFDDTTTELSLSFKIHTTSEFPSDSVKNVKLRPAAIQIPKSTTQKTNQFYDIFVLNNGNILYEESAASGGGRKVRNLVNESEYVDYASSGTFIYYGYRQNSSGDIFAYSLQRAIFNLNEGGVQSTYFVFPNSLTKISALEFDKDENLWVGTQGDNRLYRITPAKDTTGFPLVGEVVSLRAYDGADGYYLYANVIRDDSLQSIVRMPINGATLGAEEEILDFSSKVPQYYSIIDFNFTTDGTLFLATGSSDYKKEVPPLHFINSSGDPEVYYPALLEGRVMNHRLVSASWGLGDEFYYVKQTTYYNPDGTVDHISYDFVKVNTQKQTAPYYGRD